MPRSLTTLVATLLVLSVAPAACGGSKRASRPAPEEPSVLGPPVPLRVERPFFVPGEQMSWDLSLRYFAGGVAVMAFGHPDVVDGQLVLVVRSRLESAGLAKLVKYVRDDVTTWVDLRSGLPTYHRIDVTVGDKRTQLETRFGAHGFAIAYRTGDRGRQVRHVPRPGSHAVHDTHSAIASLRAWRAKPGTRAYFYLLGGRHVWQSTVRFTGRETVDTRLGRFSAVRLDGVALVLTTGFRVAPGKKPRYYSVWISDDMNRLPLRVRADTEYGPVTVELTRYHRQHHISRR